MAPEKKSGKKGKKTSKDKDAPIFEVASYGIVGDLVQVIPAITSRLREIKAAKGLK